RIEGGSIENLFGSKGIFGIEQTAKQQIGRYPHEVYEHTKNDDSDEHARYKRRQVKVDPLSSLDEVTEEMSYYQAYQSLREIEKDSARAYRLSSGGKYTEYHLQIGIHDPTAYLQRPV